MSPSIAMALTFGKTLLSIMIHFSMFGNMKDNHFAMP
jgi:hypothetical protein